MNWNSYSFNTETVEMEKAFLSLVEKIPDYEKDSKIPPDFFGWFGDVFVPYCVLAHIAEEVSKDGFVVLSTFNEGGTLEIEVFQKGYKVFDASAGVEDDPSMAVLGEIGDSQYWAEKAKEISA